MCLWGGFIRLAGLPCWRVVSPMENPGSAPDQSKGSTTGACSSISANKKWIKKKEQFVAVEGGRLGYFNLSLSCLDPLLHWFSIVVYSRQSCAVFNSENNWISRRVKTSTRFQMKCIQIVAIVQWYAEQICWRVGYIVNTKVYEIPRFQSIPRRFNAHVVCMGFFCTNGWIAYLLLFHTIWYD